MNLLCRLGFHRPLVSRVWNDGHYFSACERCGTDMIRTPEQRWRPVPKSLHVVWKPRTADDIRWPTHLL